MYKWITTRTRNQKLLLVLLVLSILAVADAAFLTYRHYSNSPDALCAAFGGAFDCDRVNKSPYSTLDNIFYFLAVDLGIAIPIITIAIPIAIVAIVTFIFIHIGALHIWHNKHFAIFSPAHILHIMRWVLAFSFIYGMWLVYIQKYVIRALCIYCVALDVLIILSLITAFMIDHEEVRLMKKK